VLALSIAAKGILPDGEMTDKKRLDQIPEHGPHMGMFQMWPRPTALREKAEWESEKEFQAAIPFFGAPFANPDERFLTSYLALLSQGQISPQNLPWLIDA
jgi:hypothetical protein